MEIKWELPFHSIKKRTLLPTFPFIRARERMLNQLNIYLCMSEKEVAVVAFPLLDGRFDARVSSTDEQTHAWCRDIFNYYWEYAYPRLKLADKLFWWLEQHPAIIQVFKQIAQEEALIHNEVSSVLEEKFLIKVG